MNGLVSHGARPGISPRMSHASPQLTRTRRRPPVSGLETAGRTLLVFLALVFMSGCGEGAPSGNEAPAIPSPATEIASPTVVTRELRGIDVSHHSGAVDWAVVSEAGYAFAIVKATEGVDALDPRFAEHWNALSQLDMLRGAYHFYVSEDDPEEQARFFLSTVELADGDLVPVVDVELIGHGTTPGLADRLRRFLEIVEGELGARPIIYTMPNFWDASLGEGFAHHPLWVAEYEVDEPRLPRDWTDWHLWQYQGDATVPGVEKSADLSRIRAGTDMSPLLYRRTPEVRSSP
jgi:lysozyme